MRRFFAAGIIFIIAAIVCLGLSLFFGYIAKNTLDASNEFYRNLFLKRDIFRYCGIGLAAIGLVCFLINIKK